VKISKFMGEGRKKGGRGGRNKKKSCRILLNYILEK
jgi:hypothetical protein